jgi:hypothetical protein
MQNSVIHIIKELEGAEQFDAQLSFRGFINFLKERQQHEKTMKTHYLDFVIHHFEQRLDGRNLIPLEEMSNYGDLLELVYASVFPAIADEHDNLWGIAIPASPVIFYGTDPFYDMLRDPETKHVRACMMDKQDKVRKKINYELIYSLILKQLYDIDFTAGNSLVRSWVNEETGLASFFRLNIDTRFIQVVPKGPLSDVDPQLFHSGLSTREILTWLMEHVPLKNFLFEGISPLTVTDVTEDYVVDNIKNIILNPANCNCDNHHDEVIKSLKILSGTNELNFGLLPFLKVNDRPVFSDEMCHYSVLAKALDAGDKAEEVYLQLVTDYFKEPRMAFYETIPALETGEVFFLEPLRKHGVASYALLPVYYNNQLAGVLEVSSRKTGVLNNALLSRLEVVMPLLAQLLRRTTEEFEQRLKGIVKENFTSIQPAVEWKFNDAAWHYERQIEMDDESVPVMETIFFKDVFPLYGAIDIRNSTIERNSALRRDLQVQFGVLTETLIALKKAVNLQLLEDLLFQSRNWQRALAGVLTTADEMNLSTFLKEKIGIFFTHFKESRPDVAQLIAPYLNAIDETRGIAFTNRRNLETSIQLINKTINDHLEDTEAEIQKTYPSYFEKFRTDGVEYDIYIGQSIAPDKLFDVLYLRNLRLWQLHSMATIARMTHDLLPEMPEPLLTTQLIFVHSAPIDISFRKDERRFDVEGGYNIRYQIVKKRIDKVHVLETNERLTQPGKIAIIYLNSKEAEEYRGYITYLQEKGLLEEEVEDLELEELQGVSGLRALRVSTANPAEGPSLALPDAAGIGTEQPASARKVG